MGRSSDTDDELVFDRRTRPEGLFPASFGRRSPPKQAHDLNHAFEGWAAGPGSIGHQPAVDHGARRPADDVLKPATAWWGEYVRRSEIVENDVRGSARPRPSCLSLRSVSMPRHGRQPSSGPRASTASSATSRGRHHLLIVLDIPGSGYRAGKTRFACGRYLQAELAHREPSTAPRATSRRSQTAWYEPRRYARDRPRFRVCRPARRLPSPGCCLGPLPRPRGRPAEVENGGRLASIGSRHRTARPPFPRVSDARQPHLRALVGRSARALRWADLQRGSIHAGLASRTPMPALPAPGSRIAVSALRSPGWPDRPPRWR
jgi:hypothetical protein